MSAQRVPLSFTIPLAADLSAANVHFLNPAGKEVTGITEDPITEELETVEVDSTACLGTPANPTAANGHLCVYTAALSPMSFGNIQYAEIYNPAITAPTKGASKVGASLGIQFTQNKSTGWGTWAVTAP